MTEVLSEHSNKIEKEAFVKQKLCSPSVLHNVTYNMVQNTVSVC